MDWSNENFVRLYTRETDDDLVLSWEARAVWHEMLKRFDRSGLIALRRGRKGLAAMLRMPVEVVEQAVPELLEDGRVRELEAGYFAPNFMEAQEANKSDRQRQKESRERRRAKHADVTNRDSDAPDAIESVTNRDADPNPVTNRDANVTPPREVVTLPSYSVSSSSIPEISPARAHAIPPSAEPVPPPTTELGTVTLAQRQKINSEIWEAARLAHDLLRTTGVDREARAWPPLPMGPGGDALAARTRELAEHGDEAWIREVHHRVIAVRVAESKREQHLKYFIPTRMFDRDSFWKSAELTPAQAATKRAPAIAAAPREVRVVRSDRDDAPPPEHPAFRKRA